MVFMLPAFAVLSAQSDATPPAATPAPVEANPARPTVSNPATIIPVGYLQFEQGYLGSLDSPETPSQHGLNQTVKVSVHPRLMIELESQPFAVSTAPGIPTRSNDAGDVLLGGQAILWTPPDPSKPHATDSRRPSDLRAALPTVAFAYLNRIYSGSAPNIDLGSQDRSAFFLFSGHAGLIDVHYDLNLIVSQQSGDQVVHPTTLPSGTSITHPARRAQYGQALSINRSFGNPNLQYALELYHFTQPFVHDTSTGQHIPRSNLVGALLAISYQLKPNLVFDTGFEHGLTSTSTQWQSFAGFTYLLPKRLWPERPRSMQDPSR